MRTALSPLRVPLAAALATALLSQAPALAQLEFGGAPVSDTTPLASVVPTEAMPFVDVEALRAEDLSRGKGQAFRFGEMIDVQLGLDNAGIWEELPDGSRVWRLRVESKGAYSLSFIFSRYQLPDGGELYVYNDDRTRVRGAYTFQNHNENGQFAIQPIEGDAVTFEYFEPAGSNVRAEITLGTVVHDYVDILGRIFKAGGGGVSRACETDVNCPEGDNWRDQIDATTKVFIGGYVCSGSLLNNTARDGTQYYMCANHCGSMNSAVFMFNYQRSGCESGTSPTNMTVQGSVEMATNSNYDFRLARITQNIPASYGAILAGWDRTDSAPPSTVAVHHPQGQPKKISFDYDPPGKSGTTQWRIYQWDLGVTEPGSSGSPLYTNEGLFIGQLCCGAAACGYPYDDYYGRMGRQFGLISNWLDPLGTGETKIELYDPNGGPAGPTANFTASPTTGNEDLTVNFTDTSTGTGLSSWAWNFGDSGSSAVRNPVHIYTDPGTYTVSLTVTDTIGSDTETKTDYIVVNVDVSATAVSRNGSGINPNIFTSTSLPILGTDWTSEVDAGSLGVGGFVFVFVYAGGIPGTPTAFGELMLDPSSAWLFTDLAIAVGGTSLHAIAVPNDIAYLGGGASAQAYLNNVAPSGKLTNAIDLVLGY